MRKAISTSWRRSSTCSTRSACRTTASCSPTPPTKPRATEARAYLTDGGPRDTRARFCFPVKHPDEMGDTLDNATVRLAAQEEYRCAFAEAFPAEPGITSHTIARALAAYERTLVSPPTRFDRWVAGGTEALTPDEVRGFALFTGRAKCSACHTRFAFTDHNFYDIGLPGTDKGRGKEIGLPAADFAFKTPTLRELAWTAPYMHDGSLATLEDVIAHYAKGGVARPTRSRDLARNLKLTAQERADLIAFLQNLSSDPPPEPSGESWVGGGRPPLPLPPKDASIVSRAGKQFSPSRIRLPAGRPSPSSTTTPAPTTCASSIRSSTPIPARSSRSKA